LTLAGYGEAGIGTFADNVFDIRRRVAHNILGAYDRIENVFFSPPGVSDLLFTDFQDPLNNGPYDGILQTNFFGFPIDPDEGSTNQGDSGGPAFIDDGFGGFIQVGITSGGGQACAAYAPDPSGGFEGYCSISFWTAVDNFTAWIAANNPLKESFAVAGSGLWSSAAHWSGGVVPDNFDTPPFLIPDFTVPAHYYNAHLNASGITTLSDSREVDTLGINHAAAELNIAAAGDLFVWGSTLVTAGTLRVNGLLDTADLVLLGGKLMGTGTIVADAGPVFNSATVAPGNSIGTLNIVGDYVQGPLGTFEVEVDATSADRLNATGDAFINGTIKVVAIGTGPDEGDVFRVLDPAGDLFGTFSTETNLLGGLFDFDVIYNYVGDWVDIRITAADFCDFSDGPVQDPVCAALDILRVSGTPAMKALINELQALNPGDVPAALEALNPTRLHAQGSAAFLWSDLIKSQLGRRSTDLAHAEPGAAGSASLWSPAAQLASSDASADTIASAALAATQNQAAPMARQLGNGWGLYAAGDWANTTTDQAGGIGSDKTDAGAITVGIDRAGNGYVFGVAFSSLNAEIDQNYGFGGATEGDGLAVSAYASGARGDLTIDAYMSYGGFDFNTTRTVQTAPLTFVTASGETQGHQFLIGATTAYDVLKETSVSLAAVGGLYYAGLDIDSYNETGAGGWSINVPDRTHESLKGQLGMQLSFVLDHTWGSITPFVRAQLSHEFMDSTLTTSVAFSAAPTTTFTSPGPSLGETWGTGALGVTASIGSNVNVYVRYQSEMGRHGQEADQFSVAARLGW
jgi:outer membrane autotransporter protein